jgi:hypothetical protein
MHCQNVPAARDLRVHQTVTEAVLWEALRNRRLEGLKFRRQHSIGPFVLDFCCPACRLGIELDGSVHVAQVENDAERETLLATAGTEFRASPMRPSATTSRRFWPQFARQQPVSYLHLHPRCRAPVLGDAATGPSPIAMGEGLG